MYIIVKTENPYLDLQTDDKGKFKTTKADKATHGGHLRRHGTQLITDRTVFIASNKKEYFE